MHQNKGEQGRPYCSRCNGSGAGFEFSIFSPHGFGTYCVPCEAIVDAGMATMRAIVKSDIAEAEAEAARRGVK